MRSKVREAKIKVPMLLPFTVLLKRLIDDSILDCLQVGWFNFALEHGVSVICILHHLSKGFLSFLFDLL